MLSEWELECCIFITLEKIMGWRLALDDQAQWLYTIQCLQREFPTLVGVVVLRYHLRFMCKPTPNRCAAPFGLTMKRSPQLKSHRPRGHWRSGIQPMCKNSLPSKRMVLIAATRVDGVLPRKLVGRHCVTICMLFVEPVSWYRKLHHWRFACRETNRSDGVT